MRVNVSSSDSEVSQDISQDILEIQYRPQVRQSTSRIYVYLLPTVDGKTLSTFCSFKITFAKLMIAGLERPYYIRSWRLPYSYNLAELLANYQVSPIWQECPTSDDVLNTLEPIIPTLQTVCKSSVLRLKQFQQVQACLGAEPDIEVYFCTSVKIAITISNVEMTVKRGWRGQFLNVVVEMEYTWSDVVPFQFGIEPEERLGEKRIDRCQRAFEKSLTVSSRVLKDHLIAILDSLFDLVVERSSTSMGRGSRAQQAPGPSRGLVGMVGEQERSIDVDEDSLVGNSLYIADLVQSSDTDVDDLDAVWQPRPTRKRHCSGRGAVPHTSSSEGDSLTPPAKRLPPRHCSARGAVPHTSSSEGESLATLAKRLAPRLSQIKASKKKKDRGKRH